MNTDKRADLISKIRKCLALARSANEHEAAVAMAKAQALMAEHKILLGEVEFDEATAKGNGCRAKPPLWETALLTAVRLTIPCSVILDDGEWRFVGRAPSAELAAYAFSVLHRQLKAARADYIKTKLKRVRPGRKSARADLFCEGWAVSVLNQLRKFAPELLRDKALQDYMKERFTPVTLESRKAKVKGAINDYWNGTQSGRQADLHRPMEGGSSPAMITG